MRIYSKLLFDRGVNAKVGRPNINDLLFINTSFFNFFLPFLLTVLMRTIPQANHLVFGQLEGQDPIYSTLLIGLFTFYTMLIYTRQTYFYEDTVDQSSTFKIVNQIAFMVPLGIWFLAITINYPMAHWRSIVVCTALLMLAFSAISPPRYNVFRSAIREPQINKLILVCMVLIILIFVFFLIKFDEIGGKDRLSAYVLIFIVLTILINSLILEYKRRKEKPMVFHWRSLIGNSTINAVYIMTITILLLLSFGNYNRFGNGFDIVILYFIGVRMILFCLGVLARYLANAQPIHFLSFKFLVVLLTCIGVGMITRPGKGRDHYILDVVTSSQPRNTFDAYADQWFRAKPFNDTTPIYLISGQGGGSRAGCAFFTTMALLDSMLDNNTFAMTTVSGSSNGAGFYLGIKKALPESKTFAELIQASDSTRLGTIDSILYQKDYISNSLFKLLFTDYARFLLGKRSNRQSRNVALMQEEATSYHQLSDYLKLNPITLLDSTWSSMYAPAAPNTLPLFMPLTYNIEYGVKAIHSPVQLPAKRMRSFYSVLDSIGEQQDLQINRSILTSQMFPIISASGSIDSFHYLDGGIYDNLAYETLFDLYKLVLAKRDTLAPRRPIILISIINGNYEADLKFNQINSELDATGNAVSQSLFSNHPAAFKAAGILTMVPQDKFFELKIFRPVGEEKALSFWQKTFNRFRYMPKKDKVVLSRYLTMNDIKHNIVYSAIREVDSLKLELQRFFKTSGLAPITDPSTPHK